MFDPLHTLVPKESENALLPQFEEFRKKLVSLRGKGYGEPLSFIECVSDTDSLSAVKRVVADKKTPKLKYVLVAGIGGSLLGTKGVYEALWGHRDHFDENRFPKAVFLEDLDENAFFEIEGLIGRGKEADEFLLVFVSKSGATSETKALYERVKLVLTEKFEEEVNARIICITADEAFAREAEGEGIESFLIPRIVSGRFSVFSSAGLLPLALLDVNVDEFVNGAQDALESFFEERTPDPFSIASTLFLRRGMGDTVHNMFVSSPSLFSLGLWWQELLGESMAGSSASSFLPIVSVLPRELHSLFGVFTEGNHPMHTTFLSEKDTNGNLETLLKAIRLSVEESYREKKRSFDGRVLPAIDAFSLGYFILESMLAVSLLGHFFKIDPFSQPPVDLYKKKIREKMSQS